MSICCIVQGHGIAVASARQAESSSALRPVMRTEVECPISIAPQAACAVPTPPTPTEKLPLIQEKAKVLGSGFVQAIFVELTAVSQTGEPEHGQVGGATHVPSWQVSPSQQGTVASHGAVSGRHPPPWQVGS